MNPDSDILGQLLELSTRKTKPKNIEFLELTSKFLQDSQTGQLVVALWLRDWIKEDYLLDLVHSPSCNADEISERVSRICFSGKHLSRNEIEQQLADLARSLTASKLNPLRESLLLPLFDGHEIDSNSATFNQVKACNIIGYLHIASSTKINPSRVPELPTIARSLATNIFRRRHSREFRAIKRLQEAFQNDGVDLTEWYFETANLLCDFLAADHCVVFQPHSEERLTAIAGWGKASGKKYDLSGLIAGPKSIVRAIFELRMPTVRLRDLNDLNERLDVCGTTDFDNNLASKIQAWAGTQAAWMASPIIFRGQVLAVVMVFNKTKNLAKQFSATDERILTSVCKYLSNVLPPILARRMIEIAASTNVSPIAKPGTLAIKQAQIAEHNLLLALQSAVPKVSESSIIIDDQTAPDGNRIIHLRLEDSTQAGDSSQFLLNASNTDPASGSRIYVTEIPNLQQTRAKLVTKSHSAPFTEHERDLIDLFSRVCLTNWLKAKEFLETEMRVFVEMRHNIRAGLHGLGHLDVAMNIFTFLRKKNYPYVVPLLQKAGKSIRRAHLYAETSRVLMEHSRILHTGLTNSDLSPTKVSIGEIAREVSLALSPDSERYHVTVDLDDKIPRNEEVEVDRPLMYIVFFNLAENAIKYSNSVKRIDRHVKIRMYFKERYWHCEFHNTGSYLDEQTSSEIFQPFTRRFDSQLRKARPGTGIGLPTVQIIVKAHRGSVSVESIPTGLRKGDFVEAENTFTVSVPRVIK